MPRYLLENTNTEEQIELQCTYNDLTKFLSEHKDYIQILNNLNIGDPMIVGFNKKPNDGFRDVLKEMKKKHVRSTINTW